MVLVAAPLTLAGLALASIATAQAPNPPKGKAIQWVGHSFHVFLPSPVAKLAQEAGIKGHSSLGFDMIGASTPCQHWKKGGEGATDTNTVKEVLKAGKADVLTLATQQAAPEECIPKFTNLAFQHRKDIHVMVQETWIPRLSSAGQDTTPENCNVWGCSNRDAATLEMLEAIRNKQEKPYQARLRTQLTGINTSHNTSFTTIVPVWDAVLSLRELILNGSLPGVSKQSGLFRDSLGHPTKPLQDMASYMWFAALYNINPQGMKALGAPEQAPILQKLAWETLQKEPLNGLPK